jgi:hypothetical protein
MKLKTKLLLILENGEEVVSNSGKKAFCKAAIECNEPCETGLKSYCTHALFY